MTPPDQPFDQDAPKRKRRPGRESDRPTEGRSSRRASKSPTGEGWDDGHSSRSARSRAKGSTGKSKGNVKSGARSGSGRNGGKSGNKGLIDGLPVWALPVAGVVVVALVLFTLLRGCGSSGSSDAGTCLTDLAVHLPADTTNAYGTDLVQARKAGYDESGSLEEVGASLDATGTIPDPVSTRYRFSQLTTLEQFEARTGISPGDAECALSTGSRSVLSGSFDPVAVKGSQAGSNGDLAATEELLAMGTGSADPKAMLEPAKDGGMASDEAMIAAMDRLRNDGAYSVIVQRGSGDDSRALAAGIGVGGNKGEPNVPVTWVFKNEKAATAGRADVVDKVNTVLRGTLSIDSTDLEVDGAMVTAVIPTVEAPNLNDLLNRGVALVTTPK
ncbi:MAG: hypothetical protein ABI239_01905 [Aquihabitans sp.]